MISRAIANFISYISHPMFGPTYILCALLLINPYLFGVPSIEQKLPLIALVFASSFLVPGLLLLMMKGLEIIDSIKLNDQKQRTIPLLAVSMLYMGLFAFCRSASDVPSVYTALVLGTVVCLFCAFFLNLFTKVSLHTIGMGAYIASTIVIMELFSYALIKIPVGENKTLEMSLTAVLLILVIFAGMVGTSRLLLKAHELKDVIGGYFVGFVAVMLSVYFYF